ncbi:hypothetical protein BDQ17DRAFT_1341077 [Cyathus striatus]|nr:hypothetical protein BDQ17DRAFT_1341077 [Cyathus striatus]
MLVVPTTTTWTGLLHEIANMMSLAPKNVRVAYRLSTQARTDAYTHLSSELHYNELVTRVMKAILEHGKSRSKKEFYVDLKDISGGEKGRKAAKNSKEDGKKRKKAQAVDTDDSELSGDEASQKPKKLGPTQWTTKILEANLCSKHRGHSCLPKASGGCYHLTKQDAGSWALFCARGYESLTKPPDKLKIGDYETPSKPSSATKPEKHSPQPVHGYIPQNIGYPSMPFMPVPSPSYFPGFGPWGPSPSSPSPFFPPQVHHRADLIPSSDPPEDLEDDTLFPHIGTWLVLLDNNPGGDGHNFASFTQFFIDLKYFRISDVADSDFTAESLVKASGMAPGTAGKLLRSIRNETKSICKKEVKHAKDTKQSRYQ